jgi:multimeric flavodoxin WrbA
MMRKNPRLLVIWWSNTGGTEQLVNTAVELSRKLGSDPNFCEIEACRCDRVLTAALLASDGYLFATPECLGGIAGPMKTFFDRCYYPALGKLNGRPYATMICAGSDGDGAIRQIDRIATGWRLKPVAPPLKVVTGAQTPEAIGMPKHIDPSDLARAEELVSTLAAGLALGVW